MLEDIAGMAAKKKELFSDDDRYIVEWNFSGKTGLSDRLPFQSRLAFFAADHALMGTEELPMVLDTDIIEKLARAGLAVMGADPKAQKMALPMAKEKILRARGHRL